MAKNSSNNYYYAWNGLDENSGKAIAISTPSGSFVTPTEEVVPVQLVLQAGTYNWKIVDTATEKYVGVPSADNNHLTGQAIATTENFLWIISTDGTATVQNASIHYRYLKFNSNSGTPNFGAYGENEPTTISLYKQVNPGSSLILYNGIDNTAIIDAATTNSKYDVTLKNRMLYKDGKWNTLCLPFNVETISGSPLAGATIMELDTEGKYKMDNNVWTKADDGTQMTGFDASSGTLFLFFKTAESIVAGKPYIIKWESTSGTIESPTFNNVTINNTVRNNICDLGNGTSLSFCGTYKRLTYDNADPSILFIGDNNTLYYPESGATIGAQRAYFKLEGFSANTSAPVREFVLNLESNNVEGITETSIHENASVWYDLNGSKLNDKPTTKGIYINGNHKVVIK